MGRPTLLLIACAGVLAAQSPGILEFRIAVGLTGRASRLWEGEVTVSGGELAGVQGWQFSQNDVARPNGKFEFRTKIVNGVVVPEGLAIRVRGDEASRIRFQTRSGAFEFAASDVPPGTKLSALNGSASVERTA